MNTSPFQALVDKAVQKLQAIPTTLKWKKGKQIVEYQDLDGFEPIALTGFSREQLVEIVTQGYQEPEYRAEQLWHWMYVRLAASFDEMTNLSKTFRDKLSQTASISSISLDAQHTSSDLTAKSAWRLYDGAVVESVLIPFETYHSLCISSQVGCAMGCTFCYTAKMGLSRHLSVSEIVEQVVHTRRRSLLENEFPITNIVFMGMGEPLHNVDAVIQACKILTDDQGLNFSKRRVTVSTSGLIPAISRYMKESDCQLAVSVNASNDIQRSAIMPVNDRYHLSELISCLEALDLDPRQRITLEYVLLGGFNDSKADALRLVKLTRNIPCKVNLIPFNPHPETPFKTPDQNAIEEFQKVLVDHHVAVFRRKTRGRQKMAACGQLGKPSDQIPRHLEMKLKKLHEQHG